MTVPALRADPRAALGAPAIQAFCPRHAYAPEVAAETARPIARPSSLSHTLASVGIARPRRRSRYPQRL